MNRFLNWNVLKDKKEIPKIKTKITKSRDYNNDDFFLLQGVENCCYPHLKVTFETLLLQKKCNQQELADYLSLDKAYISRMVHGIIIPPLRIRLKVAEFFGVDSVLIWHLEKKEAKEEDDKITGAS